MDSNKCRIENGILYPCETLDKALQDGNCAKGLNYLEITHLPTGTVTKSMAVVHSGDLPKRGVVANYCPFCGEAIAHHVGGSKPCIPTETLEAGVVVVPVEELRKRLPALIRATAEMVLSERRKLDNDQLDEELKDLSALSQTTAKMESKLGSFIEWLYRLQQNGAQTEPPSRYTVTLTDEERQIVCEALSVYTDHCAEYEDHPTAAVRETASTKKLQAWAILSRLQQNGGARR